MAFTKPDRVGRFAGTSTTETSNSTEPSSGKKDLGWELDEPPPSSIFNWLHYRYYQWTRWLNERFFDVTSGANFKIKSPEPAATSDVGGSLDIEGGDSGTDSNKNGGFVDVSGGKATGNGFSQVILKAATRGASGATIRTPENYLLARGDLAKGSQWGVVQVAKPFEAFSPSGSSVSSILADATAGTGNAIEAKADLTTPAKSALYLWPQDTDPSAPNTGGQYVNSASGQAAAYNNIASPARFVNMNTLIKALTADGSSIVNTTTETLFAPAITLPADTLRVGSIIKVTARGEGGTNGGPPTLTLRVRLNGTSGPHLFFSAKVISTGFDWRLETEVTIRTIGASGTYVAQGWSAVDESPITGTWFVLRKESNAIDTTSANTVSVTGQWSIAHADNTTLMTNWTVEVL
jgi:hypothetical protein